MSSFSITNEERKKMIADLTDSLVLLRTKAGVSQSELANIIGVSRQTYGSIERRTQTMTWCTYLSLILFFDYCKKTHHMIRSLGVFPDEYIKQMNVNSSDTPVDIDLFVGDEMKGIVECLDDQAISSIRTMIMIEYARCKNIPGDSVVKSFNGISFSKRPGEREINATAALKNIKESNRANDNQ